MQGLYHTTTNNTMELLYIWIEDYKNINKQGFNFSPKHWFYFKYKEEDGKVIGGTLQHETRNSNYPPNFFGENISNVTAIVGKNGSGKSSLMEALLNFTLGSTSHMITNTPIIDRKHSGFKTIIIYKDENEKLGYTGFSNIIGEIKHVDANRKTIQCHIKAKRDFGIDDNNFSEPGKQLKRVNFIPSYLNILPCYYSNIFDEAKIIEYKDHEDIVTHQTIERHSRNTIRTDISINKRLDTTANIELFYFKEIEKQATFISQFLKREGKFPFRLPPYFITQLKFEKNTINKYKKNLKESWLQAKIITSEIPNKISEQIVFYLWLIGLGEIKKSDSEEKAKWSKALESMTAIPNNEWFEKFSTFKQKLDLILSSSEKKSDTEYIQTYFNGVEELINTQILSEYDNRRGNTNLLVSYRLQNNTELKKMTEFMNCYEKISTSRLYQFGFSYEENFVNNTLSSGEKTLLKFGSNLWQLNTNISKNYSDNLSGEFKNSDLKTPENLLLMLDEAELTLHPEWQKIFLDWSLKIIQIVCSNFNSVQVLYSSHSPFFLSDLPKGNVIFLKSKTGEDKNGNKINQCHTCTQVEQAEQTFGANIHSLYRNSFFLENGLMGEFAKGKIDGVIKDLNQDDAKNKLGEKEKEEILFVIKQIGEPIIRRKLQQMYDEIFHSPEQIDNRIKALEAEIKQLKERKS